MGHHLFQGLKGETRQGPAGPAGPQGELVSSGEPGEQGQEAYLESRGLEGVKTGLRRLQGEPGRDADPEQNTLNSFEVVAGIEFLPGVTPEQVLEIISGQLANCQQQQRLSREQLFQQRIGNLNFPPRYR